MYLLSTYDSNGPCDNFNRPSYRIIVHHELRLTFNKSSHEIDLLFVGKEPNTPLYLSNEKHQVE